MRTKLKANAHPVLIPIGAEDQLEGQDHIINRKAVIYADDKFDGFDLSRSRTSMKRVKAIRGVGTRAPRRGALQHRSLCSKNSSTKSRSLRRDQVRHPQRNDRAQFVPVVGGSAFKNKGVQFLVDAVIDYLPSPIDIPPQEGHNPDNLEEKIPAPPDDAQNLLALPSSCGVTRLSANSCFSACIAASFRRATPSSTRAPTRPIALAGSSRFRPTSVRTSTRATRVTSRRSLASAT